MNNKILKAIKEGLNSALQDFNEEDNPFYFKDEWIPSNKDWETMIMNMNNFSNLHNIFNRIQNPDKYVKYYLIAKAINYPNIKEYFYKIGRERLRRLGLFYGELHIVEDKNIDIPKQVLELISNYKEGFPFGGISMAKQDLGNFYDDRDLFIAIDKIPNLSNITFYKIPVDYQNIHKSVRIIKFELENGSICYVKVTREAHGKHSIKTLDGYYRDIDKGMLRIKLELYLHRYITEKIIDGPYTLNVL